MNQAILTGGLSQFKSFVNSLEITLPDNTIYTIDKVVRDRLKSGRFGIDFSEYINIENDEEHKIHYYHHEMLRLGKTSIEVPFVPWSDQLRERLSKSPLLSSNKQTKNPSKFKTIREPRKWKRAKTIKKYGSCRKGNGTAKEDYKDWRMRKRASERMRERLIQQAKDEVRKGIYLDMVEAFHSIIKEQQEQKDKEQQDLRREREQPKGDGGKDEAEELKNLKFKNFKDFMFKTRFAIYPNPMF